MTSAGAAHSDVPVLRPDGGASRAFTLIELLTVIAVIAILVSIVIVVGSGVLGNQRVKQTEAVLLSLDRALDEYVTVAGAIPRYGDPAEMYNEVPGPNNGVQTYQGEEHCARPDAAVFLRQARGFGEVDAIVQGIPEKYMRLTIDGNAADPADPGGDPTPSVVDAWAEPGWPPSDEDDMPYPIEKQQVIYYVHPDNTLAQDLYGQCVNRRPYFMSAGPDMLYGLTGEPLFPGATLEAAEQALDDNIYSYPVGDEREGMSAREWNPS